MGALTLEELRLVKKYLDAHDWDLGERGRDCRDAISIIDREIKLKELNPVTGKQADEAHSKEDNLS